MANLPHANINGKFILDGKEYEIETFKVKFSQPADYKGQPQHEVKGGQLMVTITQNADNNLYLWAKTSTMRKGGQILFQTDLGITVLRINFSSAYCITLARDINTMTGTKTTLVIAPEIVTMNGVEHDNFWPK
jgi:hypothetical protein